MRLNKTDIVIYVLIMFFVGFLGAYVGLKVMEPRMAAKYESAPSTQSETGTSNVNSDPRLQNVLKSYDLIVEHFFEEVDEDELLEGAIEGMLATLDDPYSSYLNADANAEFEEQIESSFQGIGAEVSMIDGKVTIISPIKDSPAEKSGLRPNDVILAVDNEKVDGYNLNEVVAKIRGEKGSEVVLLVQRGTSSEPFELPITRDDIPIETVYASIEEVDGKKTGVIEITSFAQTTAKDFIAELEAMEVTGIDGLVIDVRGNPGGLLDAVGEILSEFVPKDIPYVQREDRNGKIMSNYSELEEKKPYPINVIIDEGSASASEVLAIAMKDIGYDVVGMTSFGKGTVQQLVTLADGGAVKLTFSKWLSPNGTWVNEVGIEPTIEQKLPDFFYVSPVKIEEALVFDQSDEKIKSVQVMLTGLNFDTGRKDGYFDKNTEAAVKEFQLAHNLPVTGELDQVTYDKLEGEIIMLVRSGEQDLQLKKALETLYK